MKERFRNRITKRLLAGCSVLLLAVLGWFSRSARPPRGEIAGEVAPAATAFRADPPRLAPAVLQVAENVFMLGDMFPSVAYAVRTSAGLALIDSGLEAEYDQLTRGLRRLGLDLSQLKIILLTHAHGDHSMGARRLRQETGAKIYVGAGDAGALRTGGPWEAIYSKFDADEMGDLTTHPTEVDGELVDGQVFQLGEARFTCLATPGHTPGSFCFLLKFGETTALFTGDTVTNLSNGLGTYAATLPPRYGGDIRAYLASLRRLSRLPVAGLVLPGHPCSDAVAQRPNLTQAEWDALVGQGIAALEQWSGRFDNDGADFLDGTPREVASGLYYLGDFDEHACYALATESRLFLFDAPGGERAAELLEDAWRRLGVTVPPLAAILLTSCRDANTSGLRTVVNRTGCQVVASPRGIDTVARLCPAEIKVLSSNELNSREWHGIEAIPLSGRDDTSIGYRFTLDDSSVLISDLMPIEGSNEELARFRRAISQGGTNRAAFEASLSRLEKIRPDIWLSARPLHGRNANLYDDDWRTVLRLNREFLTRSVTTR